MAIALLGSWGTGLSHTAEAGSDRLLVLVVGREAGSDTSQATAATYGGQAMTLIDGASIALLEGTTSISCHIFYLLESGIAAASSANFSITWSGAAPGAAFYSHAFFSGANQSTQPVSGAENATDTNVASGSTFSTGAVTTEADGLVVAAFDSGAAVNFTWTAPTTAVAEQDDASAGFTLAVAYDATTGSNVTPSGTVGGATSNRCAMVAASFKPAGSGAQTLTPSLFTNTQTFYAPTVGRGAVSLTPSLFTNSQTFHGPTVTANYGLTPTLFTNTQTFHAATVTPGGVTLTPALFTNSQTFYAATAEIVAFWEAVDRRDGAPGRRIRFRGRYYDSIRDRRYLAEALRDFFEEKAPEPTEQVEEPVAIETEAEEFVIPAQVVLDDTEIREVTRALAGLKAKEAQLQAYLKAARAYRDLLDEEDLMMLVA